MSPVRFRLKRLDWPLLLASIAIVGCIFAVVYAANLALTGNEGQDLPEQIEQIRPVRSGQPVPAQTSVFVDLLPGYEGVLVIDGLELETVNLNTMQSEPGKQVTLPATTIYEPGNATLTFTPTEDAPITEFSQGQHIVQVIYWKTIEGRSTARSYRWSFEVF